MPNMYYISAGLQNRPQIIHKVHVWGCVEGNNIVDAMAQFTLLHRLEEQLQIGPELIEHIELLIRDCGDVWDKHGLEYDSQLQTNMAFLYDHPNQEGIRRVNTLIEAFAQKHPDGW